MENEDLRPNPPLGTGEGEVPLQKPPEQNIDLRTMASDLKSASENGGAAPRPYTPPPPMPAREASINPVPEIRKETFVPPQADLEANLKPAMAAPVPPKKPKKGLFLAILAFIVVISLGAAAYFLFYPKFFGTAELPPVTENQPAPLAPLEPPAVQNQAPTGEEPPASLPSMIDTHLSLFKIEPDLATDVVLSSKAGEVKISEIKQTLTLASREIPPFTEITFKDADGKILSFFEFARIFAPATFNKILLENFEGDFSYFVFTDGSGNVWPGFIAKVKNGVSSDSLKTTLAGLEGSGEVSGFFLADPGTAAAWKDGLVNGKAARYISFSQTGAALSYAWFDNLLVVSTNYSGAKEAAKRLGFQ